MTVSDAEFFRPLSYATLCMMFTDMISESGDESDIITREMLMGEINRLAEVLSLQAQAQAVEDALDRSGAGRAFEVDVEAEDRDARRYARIEGPDGCGCVRNCRACGLRIETPDWKESGPHIYHADCFNGFLGYPQIAGPGERTAPE